MDVLVIELCVCERNVSVVGAVGVRLNRIGLSQNMNLPYVPFYEEEG